MDQQQPAAPQPGVIAHPLTDAQIDQMVGEAHAVFLSVAGQMNPHIAIAALTSALKSIAVGSGDAAYITGVASLLDEEASSLRRVAIEMPARQLPAGLVRG